MSDDEQLQELEDLYIKYQNDPRLKHLRKPGIRMVKGRGPMNPDVMLVGEAPGRLENAHALPFMGAAGIHLTNLLEDVKIDPLDVFFTNALKYWPQDEDGKTRAPTEDEIEVARDYLIEEVDIVCPRFVALCGLPAIQVFFPHFSVVHVHNGNLLDGKFVPLFHPAVVGYSPHKKREVRDGFRRLATYIKELRAA